MSLYSVQRKRQWTVEFLPEGRTGYNYKAWLGGDLDRPACEPCQGWSHGLLDDAKEAVVQHIDKLDGKPDNFANYPFKIGAKPRTMNVY